LIDLIYIIVMKGEVEKVVIQLSLLTFERNKVSLNIYYYYINVNS